MDSVNRQTAVERPDLLEWRKCQGQAGWYGVLAIVTGSSLSFAGLSVVPQIPKKYIPLFSLGVGAGCGWFTSHRVIRSCRRALYQEASSTDGNINQALGIQNSAIPPQETKFGDKGFVKE